MHKIHGATLRSVFNENHRVEITPTMINKLLSWCIFFENHKDNPNVFNTPYLGVEKTFFSDAYQDEIFNIFQINKKDFVKDISTIPSVDLSRNIASDPFNLLCVWVAHLMLNTQMSHQLKNLGMVTMFKIMQYRFFTSLVFRRYQHKADLNIMRAVIEGLSKKFDIVTLGTWKRVIEARSEDVISDTSIHIRTIKDFKEDDDIFYVLSDIQTRLRDKLNLITQRYYDLHKQKKEIGTYSTITLHNGEKIMKDTAGSLNSMVSNLSQDILSVSNFVDNEAIKLLCGMNKELKPHMLKMLILRYIDMAIYQNKKAQLDDIRKIKDDLIITGHRKLICEIIQTTYRNCINSGTNMKNKYELLKNAGNIYRSSQIQDENILLIKKSVEYFIASFPGTTRYNTQLALRINFILYTIILSFKYL